MTNIQKKGTNWIIKKQWIFLVNWLQLRLKVLVRQLGIPKKNFFFQNKAEKKQKKVFYKAAEYKKQYSKKYKLCKSKTGNFD